MKFYLFIFIVLVTQITQAQISKLKEEIIEVNGLFNALDSSILLLIKSNSNSALIINGSENNYVDINEYLVSSISLISNGVSILEPHGSDKMFFKRLPQYSPISDDFFLCEGIYNKDLVKIIEEKKLKVLTSEMWFTLDTFNNCGYVKLMHLNNHINN
jgi:hypothetical protein